ncbi:hypothetical protein BDV95DRAFT_622451 [Massariosphaeria phaeospora]|uniref:Uncharacterized protein n=1 Tax=Massariosphaeria phaeospora TaxID=100035 RepID=A0A7C8I0C1_9PLEO|nr:hypothetical protein BDV95DRAFT_622451 [Massariosphaeria phaeospora]
MEVGCKRKVLDTDYLACQHIPTNIAPSLPQWDTASQSTAQACFGTFIPLFPSFFMLMGPDSVTGHLSVIYTVECQINFGLRLLAPILSLYHLRTKVNNGDTRVSRPR